MINPIITLLFQVGKSGTEPNQSFLGFEFISGDPNLINPTSLPVFVSWTTTLSVLPGAGSGENEAIISKWSSKY